jgi:hypothetical protein
MMMMVVVELMGLEPTTPGLQSQTGVSSWRGRVL